MTLVDPELNELYQQMAVNAEMVDAYNQCLADLARAVMLLARKIDELKREHI